MESCVGKNDDGSNFGQGEPTPFEYDLGRTSPVATCRTPRPSRGATATRQDVVSASACTHAVPIRVTACDNAHLPPVNGPSHALVRRFWFNDGNNDTRKQ